MSNYLDEFNEFVSTSLFFKRHTSYNLYLQHIQSYISSIDIKDVHPYMIPMIYVKNLIKEKYNVIQSIYSSELNDNGHSRKIMELQIDVINRYIELYLQEMYLKNNDNFEIFFNDIFNSNYYPDIYDPLFNLKIYQKQEFNENKMLPLKNVLSNNKGFSLSNNQKFAKNYMSMYTPYNGVLLWYQVGVGKTCAAISIAETYKEYIKAKNKKVLILLPSETLIHNWKNEIFNIEKEINKHIANNSYNVQCTNNSYSSLIKDIKKVAEEIKLAKENPEIDSLQLQSKVSMDKIKRQANKIINRYYDFMGYQSLANSIERDLRKILISRRNIESTKIDYIRNRFSDTIIIMDEIHITRENDNNLKDKKIRPWLEMIARYSKNTKLILLTATPMYNVSSEIVWILNLLLWNDNKSPLEVNELFDTKGIKMNDNLLIDKIFTPEDYLIFKSRGYISYVRGENPYTFPLKLEPNDPKNITVNSKYKIINGQYIEKASSEILNNFKTYTSNMSQWQFREYSKLDNDIHNFSILPIQCSNIIYPVSPTIKEGIQKANLSSKILEIQSQIDESSNDNSRNKKLLKKIMMFTKMQERLTKSSQKSSFNKEDMVGLTGDDGFNTCFTEKMNTITHIGKISTSSNAPTYKGKTYTMNSDYTNYKHNKSFFHRDNIHDISCKFKSIIDSIISSDGIIFIYSDYLTHGINAMGLFLEENGFNKISFKKGEIIEHKTLTNCNQDLFCTYNKKYKSELNDKEMSNFNQARYIQLDGSISKKELSQLVKESIGEGINSTANINGEYIKVILGSSVIEQGISFKCVREVHLLDPWFHLNQLKQSTGRAVRNYSHMNLDDNKRNVTIYLHVAIKPKEYVQPDYELVDEHVYRLAYNKQINMSKIEMILKKNAIDCGLNVYNNILLNKYDSDGNLGNLKIIDSKNKNRTINLYDKNYSSECNYDICDYKCNPDTTDVVDIDNSTYNNFFSIDDVMLTKELIKTFFTDEFVYTEDRIKNTIESIYPLISYTIIYRALNELIKNKELIYDMYNKDGFIIERDKYYIFHPNELTDTNAPLKYRYLENFVNKKEYNIDNVIIDYTKNNISTKIKKISDKAPKVINYEAIYNECNRYINNNYSEYDHPTDKFPNLPKIQDLSDYIFLSYFERHVSEKSRLQLLKNVLLNINRAGTFSDNIERALYNYYYTPNNGKFSYFIDENMIKKNGSKKLVGLVFKTESNHDTKSLYMIQNGTIVEISARERALSEYKNVFLNLKQMNNLSKLFGYNSPDNKKTSIVFYIVNKPSNFVATDKKTDRRGGVCGTAKGAKEKPELINTINKILKSINITYSKYKTDRVPNKTQSDILKGKNLCEEIELLLRHRDNGYIFSDISDTNRYFYRLEEKMYIKKYSK